MTNHDLMIALLKLWDRYQAEELHFYKSYERKVKERLPEFMDWIRQELEDD